RFDLAGVNGMRLARGPALFLAALAFNTVLFLIVPVLQAVFHAPRAERPVQDSVVQRDLYVPPPEPERPQEREIKEITLQPIAQPAAESRPTLPGGGLAIDLSPAGGA